MCLSLVLFVVVFQLKNKYREVQRVIEQIPTPSVTAPNEPLLALIISGLLPLATLRLLPRGRWVAPTLKINQTAPEPDA